MGMQVNVSEEEDDFQLVITACLSVLILGTETKLDAALVQMTRLSWASLETVRAQRAHARNPCGASSCFRLRVCLCGGSTACSMRLHWRTACGHCCSHGEAC